MAYSVPRNLKQNIVEELVDKLSPIERDQPNLQPKMSNLLLVLRVPNGDEWQLNTSAFEANLLYALPDTSAIKHGIKYGKIVGEMIAESVSQDYSLHTTDVPVSDALKHTHVL